MPQAIGIDLGTTFSCVAYMKSDTEVEIVRNHYGNKITPSVVHFGNTCKEVGEEAQAKRGGDPRNTVFQIKRFMGRAANDPEITKRGYPFEILSTRKGDVAIRVTPCEGNTKGESKVHSPEEISFYILRYMKALATSKVGSEIKDAVITVPANFNNAQRQATKDAGVLAGLNVLRIVNEPTAAALAYGFGLKADEERLVLVYDLGGGTFDVSIVRSHKQGGEVLSTAGVTDLGGEDFDKRIFDHVSNELKGKGIKVTVREEFALYQSCERAKITLSVCHKAKINFFQNGKNHECEITRQEFEELCVDLFDKTITCVEDAISEAHIDKEDIDDIVLVGGSSRIPMIQSMVREFFDDKALKFNIPPDHAVAYGATILAESLSMSADTARNSIRGAIKLADVLPFSLGTGVSLDRMDVILRRNTPYPASKTHSYSNAVDELTSIRLKILEGESALSSQNRMLGLCTIPVPPRKVDENYVLATFSVDEDCILSVHVKDPETAAEASTTVQTVGDKTLSLALSCGAVLSDTATSKLTNEERMVMIRNAKKEEETEKIERAKYEARTVLADAMLSVRRAVHRTNSEATKAVLKQLLDTEDKWFINQTDPSNEVLIARASSVKANLARIMVVACDESVVSKKA